VLAGLGAAAGVLLSMWLTPLLLPLSGRRVDFRGVADPQLHAGAATLLLLAALSASVVPARSAARVNPARALSADP
jgi:ABC-type lipoprotein release transport system permease subunit